MKNLRNWMGFCLLTLTLAACGSSTPIPLQTTYRIEYTGASTTPNDFNGNYVYSVQGQEDPPLVVLSEKTLPITKEFTVPYYRPRAVVAGATMIKGGNVTIKIYRNGKFCAEGTDSDTKLVFALAACAGPE